ncbi:32 kDa beta-galactoside-binding lectin lec-3-like isoform X1 [Anopheles nili]|uniref:32 kDa beta-galactoside-binding lectin lec-3-like isoform X1 n=1 Tax=Anopheles nili TaxID=185578 RepID=UPI00237C1BDF|nr:32 kDa beta-galactoside-binding lectin lec-3-like isoform X1 [Anopheles nili]
MLTTFAGALSCPVSTGHVFLVRAKSIDGAERVDIGFQADKTIDSDALLHLSVQFEEQRIVRNTLQGGQWQQPEQTCPLSPNSLQRMSSGKNKFRSIIDHTVVNTILFCHHTTYILNLAATGKVFTVYILVGDQQFHIAFDGIHVCSYQIKGSLANIKVITITKDVHQVLCVNHRQAFPFPYPAIQSEDPSYYFSNDVPQPFRPGHAIIVTAIPFGNPRGGFIIKFLENGSKKQALHFNPRFDPYYVVVRNSHATDALDFRQEERSGGFPFIIEQQFKLAILLAEKEFKFAINGRMFETYTYKTPRQLDVLNGFHIECVNGLQLEVTAVDHCYSDLPELARFEDLSRPDVDIV